MLKTFFHVLSVCFFSASVFLFGCTGAVNSESLLSEFKPCTGSTCSDSSFEAISGELSIIPDEGEIFSSPEGSEIVEITGSCKDLGRKSNRILVQMFEGEDDSVQPVLDNSISTECLDNISTSSLQPVAGVGKQCLFISQGIGLADSGMSSPQFPQCFNGRFSFKVKVGRIIRKFTTVADKNESSNPIVKYLVKLKLRTTENITADSAASTLVINRKLLPPIPALTIDRANDRCEILLNPSKFRDIKYRAEVTWNGPSYLASGTFTNTVSGTVYFDLSPTFPPAGNGTTVEKFYHFGQPLDPTGSVGLLPGIRYSYRLQSADYSYVSDYMTQFGPVSATAVERSDFSGEISCPFTAASVFERNLNKGNDTPNSCTMTLAGANTRGDYRIEWRVSDTSPTWMVSTPNSGFLISDGDDVTTNCRDEVTCTVHGDRNPAIYTPASATTFINASGVPEAFRPGIRYYFAARQYRDSNNNGQLDLGVDDIVGDWSPPTALSGGSGDFLNSCVFDSFPIQ